MYLAIDASTMTGSAALFDGERLVGERTVAMKGVTEERLMPAIVDLVTANGGWGGIEALVVGAGPGSFTSLRIAAGIAKGIATSLGVALNAVPSPGLLVARTDGVATGRYLATLDAMRGEWFVAIVDVGEGGRIVSVGPLVRLGGASIAAHAAQLEATIVGQFAPKANDTGHAAFAGATAAWVPHARGAGRLISAGLATVVDLATWEPDYGRLAEAQVKWEAEHGRALFAPDDAQPSVHPTTRLPDPPTRGAPTP